MARHVSQPIVVAVLAALLGYSWAQGPTLRGADDAKNAPFPVAVVDINKVMNGYKRLAERREELVRDFQVNEETVKSRVAEMQSLAEEVKRMKDGSEDQKKAFQELQTKQKAFEQFRRELQQSVAEKQSKLMLWAYGKIVDQIQQYADARSIKLVVQYHSVPTEDKTAQEIMSALQRQVIYQNALDITDEILQGLN